MTYTPIGPKEMFVNRRMSDDASIAYIGLLNTVMARGGTLLDVGCGRGAYAERSPDGENLFDLRQSGRHVIGIDVDEAARDNPFLDEFRLISLPRDQWPLDDDSVDVVACDWTLEHIERPTHFVAELKRVLRPGGAFVARTIRHPSMLSLLSSLVPNSSHAKVLRHGQPSRKTIDIFPTFYRMNSPRAISELFESFDYTLTHRAGFENYLYERSRVAARAAVAIERRLPISYQTVFILSARLR